MTNGELDKWITENVMEWQKVGYGAIGHGHGIYEPAKYGWYTKTGGMAHPDVTEWSPTTSDSDAMQVVDRLNNKGFAFQLFCNMGADTRTVDDWVAVFFKPFKPGGERAANIRPLAICLAAKEAIEGK